MADQASSSSSSDDEEDYLQQRAGTSNQDPSGSPHTIGNQHEVDEAEAEGEEAFQQISTTNTTPELTVMQLRNGKKKQQQDLQAGFDGINLGTGGLA